MEHFNNLTGKILVMFLSGLFLVGLAGCSTWDKLDKTERGAVIGTGTGAVIGGAAGDTTGAVIGGAAGGVAGGLIGRELDKEDERENRR